jgi:protein tyrosine phosphatase (PTP) superfamily phosphohydrolase (DUF442 family)
MTTIAPTIAQRLASGGFALPAVLALTLFWLLVQPVTLHATPLGVNTIEISPRLTTSGMPSVDQFQAIRAAGYQVVINLAPSTAMGAHRNEADLVTAQGMAYEHVPVDFAKPTVQDFAAFVAAMRRHAEARVFVHCQVNMRASVFVYLYRVTVLGEAPDAAYDAVTRVWQPSTQWRTLIRAVHAAHDKPLPFAFDGRS